MIAGVESASAGRGGYVLGRSNRECAIALVLVGGEERGRDSAGTGGDLGAPAAMIRCDHPRPYGTIRKVSMGWRILAQRRIT